VRGGVANAEVIFRPDRFPAYMTWEQYEQHQQRLQENDVRGDGRGAPRSGLALLGGIVYCGHCRRRMSPQYLASGQASYGCRRHRSVGGAQPCQNSIGSPTLDAPARWNTRWRFCGGFEDSAPATQPPSHPDRPSLRIPIGSSWPRVNASDNVLGDGAAGEP
jgi:hypothetical protein